MKPLIHSLAGLFLLPALLHAQPSLTVGNAPGYPGTVASVPVYLAQASNVVVAQFEVAFNTGKVAAAGSVQAPGLPGQRVKSRDLAPGLRKIVAYSLNAGSTRGTNRPIASLPFALNAGEYVGSGPLIPANAVLVKPDETALAPVALNPGTVFATPVNLRPDGTADFFLRSMPGTNYWIDASADLVHWTLLTTNRATSDFLESSDPGARAFDHRFYRARPATNSVAGPP